MSSPSGSVPPASQGNTDTTTQLAHLIALLEEIHIGGRSLLSVVEEEARGRRSASGTRRSGRRSESRIRVTTSSNLSSTSRRSSESLPVKITTSILGKVEDTESDFASPAPVLAKQLQPAASQTAPSSDSDANVITSVTQLALRPIRSILIPPSRNATTNQWMRSYRGLIFPVPNPNEKTFSPYYCVVKGTTFGIFTTWSEAGTYVIRIKGAVHQKTKTVDEAVRMLEYAADRGAVETLPAE